MHMKFTFFALIMAILFAKLTILQCQHPELYNLQYIIDIISGDLEKIEDTMSLSSDWYETVSSRWEDKYGEQVNGDITSQELKLIEKTNLELSDKLQKLMESVNRQKLQVSTAVNKLESKDVLLESLKKFHEQFKNEYKTYKKQYDTYPRMLQECKYQSQQQAWTGGNLYDDGFGMTPKYHCDCYNSFLHNFAIVEAGIAGTSTMDLQTWHQIMASNMNTMKKIREMHGGLEACEKFLKMYMNQYGWKWQDDSSMPYGTRIKPLRQSPQFSG